MKKRLKDIADFRIGYQFRGKVKPDPAGTVRVIQIKDIMPDLQIRLNELETVTIERLEPHRVQQGDVLFLSRGHRLYAVVLPAVEPNTIATGYFFVLPEDPNSAAGISGLDDQPARLSRGFTAFTSWQPHADGQPERRGKPASPTAAARGSTAAY